MAIFRKKKFSTMSSDRLIKWFIKKRKKHHWLITIGGTASAKSTLLASFLYYVRQERGNVSTAHPDPMATAYAEYLKQLIRKGYFPTDTKPLSALTYPLPIFIDVELNKHSYCCLELSGEDFEGIHAGYDRAIRNKAMKDSGAILPNESTVENVDRSLASFGLKIDDLFFSPAEKTVFLTSNCKNARIDDELFLIVLSYFERHYKVAQTIGQLALIITHWDMQNKYTNALQFAEKEMPFTYKQLMSMKGNGYNVNIFPFTVGDVRKNKIEIYKVNTTDQIFNWLTRNIGL